MSIGLYFISWLAVSGAMADGAEERFLLPPGALPDSDLGGDDNGFGIG